MFSTETIARVLGLAVGAVGIVVCGMVRDLGRRLQPQLWRSWGGSPTVQRLRFRDAADPAAVGRLHARIDPLLDFSLPTEAEESEAPDEADRRYDDAVATLRELTRDSSRFRLVFAENAEYGFRRNSLGLRWVGFALALVAVGISVASLTIEGRYDAHHLSRWLVPACIGFACAMFWLVVVRPHWVRTAAELYADRLLEAAVSLRA